MKKVFATLLVGMLAVFSFAAFEVTGGYTNATLDESLTVVQSDVTMHGISFGANYLFEGLGIEGGALLVGGSFDYYFPSEDKDVYVIDEVTGETVSVPMNFSQTSFSVNGGYRQSLNVFFPDLAVGMYVQGLFNYSFGTVTAGTSVESLNLEEEADSSSWGFGGGAGASFVVQNLDMNVGADLLFEKVTLTDFEGTDYEANQWKPKFKIHAGLQF
ncbi:outer membrane beta-barrel protein [Petrotoga halophila]|uniref:Outer membrane protein beta-barrel domain-containing protein n=1 Tax=Petrotoga halophila DSM 16923 TaxID=1122953 RepID=A0A2S5E8P1_9BACT|nr:outer membrane beta-barrel protein [Petrotoga halophila]POZ89540.1 hypothetical protein AA81_13645 [Petrotoga halophila DSM 16923]